MDAEENQRQVFLRAHSPWKSHTTRFPHFHSPCSAWKSGKPKAGFPLSHLLSLLLNQIKKGNPTADRFAPAFRLILRLEYAISRISRHFSSPVSLIRHTASYNQSCNRTTQGPSHVTPNVIRSPPDRQRGQRPPQHRPHHG